MPAVTGRPKSTSDIETFSLASRLARALHNLFDSNGQVTYPLSCRVIDRIGDCGRHRHRRQFAQALCAQRACFLVELTQNMHIEFWDVGVGRNQIAGIVAAEIAAGQRIRFRLLEQRLPKPQMMPPIAWLRAVFGLMMRPAS